MSVAETMTVELRKQCLRVIKKQDLILRFTALKKKTVPQTLHIILTALTALRIGNITK
jgi:hypothetical protein